MAENPVIHNDGGIYRFRDFISQIPEFLRTENDVIVLLQLFSDYINNAYRNITTVKKFEFKLISVESRIGATHIRLSKLAKLFKETEHRNHAIIFLSKPVSTPVTSNDYFLGIFEHTGTLETLSPAVITFPLAPENDGNRAYIEFTKYPEDSGVYVFNYSQNTLTLDPFNTSQDPFLNTPNKPIPTVGGLSPRMIQFEPSNISNVSTRKISKVGTTIYYEVYFTATLNNIQSLASIVQIEPTSGDPYLIDYYKAIDTLPGIYKYRYVIDFPSQCANLDWSSVYEMGNGLFYARDLTQYASETLQDIRDKNVYIDPIFDENKTDISISSIHGDRTTVTVVTKLPHTLNVSSRFNIQNTVKYNDYDKIVSAVINDTTFQYLDTSKSNAPETTGNINIPNLAYYRAVNKKGKLDFYLKIPYKDLEGTTEFASGDIVVRLVDREELEFNTFNANEVNTVTDDVTQAHYITLNTDPALFKLAIDDMVTLRNSAGTPTFPGGINQTISSLTYSETAEIATAVCASPHGLRTGFRVNISGAVQTEYNGMVEITVVNKTTFTYVPITVPTVFTATGTITMTYALTEGEAYNIADILHDDLTPNTYKIKLKDVIITAPGSGKIDIVKLNVYFNGVDDIDTETNKITLRGGTKVIEENKPLNNNGDKVANIHAIRPVEESKYRHLIFVSGNIDNVVIGSEIRISGAQQTEYNGIFSVTNKYSLKVLEIVIPDVETLHEEVPTTAQLQFPNIGSNPLDGLQEGHAIKIRGGGSLTLPAPLSEELTYNILEIDTDDDTIVLSTDGVNPVDIYEKSPGTFDIVKLNRTQDVGIVKSVEIGVAGDTGHIILDEYEGDFISKGTIGKITDEIIDFRATIAEVKSIDTSLSGDGFTVTAITLNAHKYVSGKTVTISGANQPGFNGKHVITVTGETTYTYANTGTGDATGNIKSTYFIDSTSVVWNSGVNNKANNKPEPIYKKNDFVVYEKIRYKLRDAIIVAEPTEIGGDIITRNPGTPDKLNDFYEKAMNELSIPKYNIEKNPYMFGLFRTKSLAFDEDPDFNSGYDDLARDLYIRQVDQLELIYGHDQRDWYFSPRAALPSEIIRNGFLEVLSSNGLADDIVNIDAEPYVRANAEHPLLLEGTELNITRTISSLTYSSTTGLITAVCTEEHRLKTGLRVEISGADQSEYNGIFQIDVVYPNTFTYEPTTEPTVTPATTGSSIIVSFDNTVVFEIKSLAVESPTEVRVVTESNDHGLRNGNSIKISGAAQSGYNVTSTIILTDNDPVNEFVYTVADTTGFLPEDPTDAIATYQPLDGDYINAQSQVSTGERGIYTARNREWLKFDDTQVTQNTTIFTQENLFDVSETNPSIAKGKLLRASLTRSGNEVTATVSEYHNYSVGTIVNIAGVSEAEYNGRFTVTDISSPLNANQFKYKIRTIDTPSSPATPATNNVITCQSDKWYKFDIREIQWQKLSNALTYTTVTGNREYFIKPNKSADEFRNNVTTLSNEFSFEYVQSLVAVSISEEYITLTDASNYQVGDELLYTANGDTITGLDDGDTYIIEKIISGNKIKLKDVNITAGSPVNSYFTQILNIIVGDLVNVNDQILSHENGKYRVEKSTWKRLSTKIAMKIRDITVDARVIDVDEFAPVPYLYNVYNENEVDAYIAENFSGDLQLYKTYSTLTPNFQFAVKKVENMDTTDPIHKMYNAKFDKNTVANRSDMDSDFLGVNDMGYPLVEKIERLAYLKDPNVIDFEFINNLARYMGYDMAPLTDDIAESIFYKTDEEKEMSVRRILSNLPYFNALRATKPGLEALLLTFGLVGKIVTMWTDAASPYQDFIPDYNIREVQYARMYDGNPINVVPTPHFKLNVDIEGNFDNQVSVRELKRLTNNIEIYKPINTVFDGIILYFETTGKISMYAGEMRAKGYLQADVGYEAIEFDYGALLDSDCI